jgi:hypothetical protein
MVVGFDRRLLILYSQLRSGHLLIRWARSIDAYNLRKRVDALPQHLFLA